MRLTMLEKEWKVKNLLSSLEAYSADGLLERNHKREMISFLKNNDTCFERSCWRGHFTASAWVVNSEETHILLMHHRKLGIWVQLGGHADGDKNLLAVSMKEVWEESGIKTRPITDKIFDISIHHIPEYELDKEHYHYDVRFLLKSTGNDTIVKNEESIDIRWFQANEECLPTKNPCIIRMLNKWMGYKKEVQVSRKAFEKELEEYNARNKINHKSGLIV